MAAAKLGGLAWGWLLAGAALAGPGLGDYFAGLERLARGDAPAALADFERAVAADDEAPEFLLARGVGRMLTGAYGPARADLERAAKLRGGGDPELRTWLASAVRLAGDLEGANLVASTSGGGDPYLNKVGETFWKLALLGGLAGPRDDDPLSFVPGHLRAQAAGWDPETLDSFRREYLAKKSEKDAERAAVVRGIREVGGLFASRKLAGLPALEGILLARGQARRAAGDRDGALEDLERAAGLSPLDVGLLALVCEVRVEAGAVAAARRDLTRLLTVRTADAGLYLLRAEAAGRMGDGVRARADLAIARTLDPGAAAARAGAVEAAIAAGAAGGGDVAGAAAALAEGAAGTATDDELVVRAARLVRAAEAGRRRHDEDYQDRLRTLEAAVRAAPGEAAAKAALAEFVFLGAEVRGEKVEPRAPLRPLRDQSLTGGPGGETRRAEGLAAEALGIDGGCLLARVVQAGVHLRADRWDPAQALLESVLAASPDPPPLTYTLYTELLDRAAQWRLARAGGLRTPETWSDTQYIYTRYPSRADLEEAGRLEAEAARMLAAAERALEAAGSRLGASAQGQWFRAVLAWRRDRADEARAALEACLALEPARVEALDLLARLHSLAGRTEAAFELQSRALNALETSAGPLLRLAAMHLARTAWTSAAAALDRAAAIDPADARVFAYRAMGAAGKGGGADPLAPARAALALERAREGRTAPAARGLEWGLRRRLAGWSAAAGKPEAALAHLDAILAAEPRFDRTRWADPLWTAMLPVGGAPTGEVPEAENLLSMLAWTRYERARVLRTLGRVQEAGLELDRVEAMQRDFVLAGAERLRWPLAWSRLERAWLGIAARDRAAVQKAFFEGFPGGDPAFAAEKGRVEAAVAAFDAELRAAEEAPWRAEQGRFEEERQRRIQELRRRGEADAAARRQLGDQHRERNRAWDEERRRRNEEYRRGLGR